MPALNVRSAGVTYYARDPGASERSLSRASVTTSVTGRFPVSISDSRDGCMPASYAKSYWVKPAQIRRIFSSNPSTAVPLEVVPPTVICYERTWMLEKMLQVLQLGGSNGETSYLR